jgi:hypothetical protein
MLHKEEVPFSRFDPYITFLLWLTVLPGYIIAPSQHLDAFSKLRKATAIFVMSACLSVSLPFRLFIRPSIGPHGITRHPLDRFS